MMGIVDHDCSDQLIHVAHTYRLIDLNAGKGSSLEADAGGGGEDAPTSSIPLVFLPK